MPAYLLRALLAGTGVALASGLCGYLLVLRAQVFAADALSHVTFTGALAALAFGVDARLGLFGATVAVALGLGLLGRAGRPDDVVIGGVFAWVLGLGVLCLTLYTTRRSTGDGPAGVSVLFGSILGLGTGDALVLLAVAVAVCLALLALARPLLFASLDAAGAAARGVPVRLLGLVFLALVGVTAAAATQAVGALLLLGLLAAPAGAAVRLTGRPWYGMALSAGLALASVWLGLAASQLVPAVPPSFAILAVATAGYAVAGGADALRRRYGRLGPAGAGAREPAPGG